MIDVQWKRNVLQQIRTRNTPKESPTRYKRLTVLLHVATVGPIFKHDVNNIVNLIREGDSILINDIT